MAVAARASGAPRTKPFGLLGDERLAGLAAAGHERAFAVVYQRHHQALYRYCQSILRNEADAQDALQSTFTAAFAALARGRPDAPIRPWLFRIAHNEAVSALRRRRPTADLSEALDCSTSSVEDQAAERARLDLLLRDLRELNERQRAALVMRELSGLSHEEIALALETSVGAAKQTIYEARQSLFEFAEGRAMLCDEVRRTISDADGRMLRSRRVRAHLRQCTACAAFSAAIPARSRELRALAPPLPVLTAAGLLARVAGAGSPHGAGGGAAGLAAGAAGKTTGAALAANALAGVAVVASATVGVTVGVDKLMHSGGHARPTPAAHSRAWPAHSAASATISTGSGAGRSASPGGYAGGARGSARAGGLASAAGSSSVAGAAQAGVGHLAAPSGSRGALPSSRPEPRYEGAAAAGIAPGAPPAAPGKPASIGSGRPAGAGSGNPAARGSGKPAWAGSGKPAAAGSGKGPSAGNGNPAAGSGKPAGSGPADSGAPSSQGPPGSPGSSHAPSVPPGETASNPPSPPVIAPPPAAAHQGPGGPPAGTPASPHGH